MKARVVSSRSFPTANTRDLRKFACEYLIVDIANSPYQPLMTFFVFRIGHPMLKKLAHGRFLGLQQAMDFSDDEDLSKGGWMPEMYVLSQADPYKEVKTSCDKCSPDYPVGTSAKTKLGARLVPNVQESGHIGLLAVQASRCPDHRQGFVEGTAEGAFGSR